MTTSTFARESVVNGYLNGKTYAEIANENNIAKSSVFNIVNTWIDHIGIRDIKEIREFSIVVRKSGITIKQCAQSFRFIQILANFGIKDEKDSRYFADIISTNRGESKDNHRIKNKKGGGQKKDHHSTSRDNFYYFIETIYNYCKEQGIKPTNIIEWMEDLIDFSPLMYEKAEDDALGFERDMNETDDLQNENKSKKSLFVKTQDTRNDKQIQIPFISKISGYIEQKKLGVQHLDMNVKELQQKIIELEEQRKMRI